MRVGGRGGGSPLCLHGSGTNSDPFPLRSRLLVSFAKGGGGGGKEIGKKKEVENTAPARWAAGGYMAVRSPSRAAPYGCRSVPHSLPKSADLCPWAWTHFSVAPAE